MISFLTSFVLYILILPIISSENFDGIFLIDSCQCNSSMGICEPKGPFLFNQKRSALSVKYGSTPIGIGTLTKGEVDLYLNQNRCKGPWNSKIHLAELKCQQQGGIICLTKLRCISGACLDDISMIESSASIISIMSFLLMIGIFIILV